MRPTNLADRGRFSKADPRNWHWHDPYCFGRTSSDAQRMPGRKQEHTQQLLVGTVPGAPRTHKAVGEHQPFSAWGFADTTTGALAALLDGRLRPHATVPHMQPPAPRHRFSASSAHGLPTLCRCGGGWLRPGMRCPGTSRRPRVGRRQPTKWPLPTATPTTTKTTSRHAVWLEPRSMGSGTSWVWLD